MTDEDKADITALATDFALKDARYEVIRAAPHTTDNIVALHLAQDERDEAYHRLDERKRQALYAPKQGPTVTPINVPPR